jgi:hypothetical protein
MEAETPEPVTESGTKPQSSANSSSLGSGATILLAIWWLGVPFLAYLGWIKPTWGKSSPIFRSYFAAMCEECGGYGHSLSKCESCRGRGYFAGKLCPDCVGKGKIEIECTFCAGSGRKPDLKGGR